MSERVYIDNERFAPSLCYRDGDEWVWEASWKSIWITSTVVFAICMSIGIVMAVAKAHDVLRPTHQPGEPPPVPGTWSDALFWGGVILGISACVSSVLVAICWCIDPRRITISPDGINARSITGRRTGIQAADIDGLRHGFLLIEPDRGLWLLPNTPVVLVSGKQVQLSAWGDFPAVLAAVEIHRHFGWAEHQWQREREELIETRASVSMPELEDTDWHAAAATTPRVWRSRKPKPRWRAIFDVLLGVGAAATLAVFVANFVNTVLQTDGVWLIIITTVIVVGSTLSMLQGLIGLGTIAAGGRMQNVVFTGEGLVIERNWRSRIVPSADITSVMVVRGAKRFGMKQHPLVAVIHRREATGVVAVLKRCVLRQHIALDESRFAVGPGEIVAPLLSRYGETAPLQAGHRLSRQTTAPSRRRRARNKVTNATGRNPSQ
ncbi:MAG: hypothetical protein AAFN41_05170 [Planctomycetota bacterium]